MSDEEKVASVTVGVDLEVSLEEFEAADMQTQKSLIIEALDAGNSWDVLEKQEVFAL